MYTFLSEQFYKNIEPRFEMNYLAILRIVRLRIWVLQMKAHVMGSNLRQSMKRGENTIVNIVENTTYFKFRRKSARTYFETYYCHRYYVPIYTNYSY